MKRIAVIGCGMSGITIANLMKNKYNVAVFEKSRGYSGRMSTNRTENFQFDHGAQYFSIKNKQFYNFMKPLLDNDIIKIWKRKHVQIKNNMIVSSKVFSIKEKNFIGVPSMSIIGRHLSKDINIHNNTLITKLKNIKGAWYLYNQDIKFGPFDWLFLTIPPEQAYNILPANISFINEIKSIKMKSCFTLMLGFKNKKKLSFDSAEVFDSKINWICVDSSKPGRNNPFSLVIQSSNLWEDANFEKDRSKVAKEMILNTSAILNLNIDDYEYKKIHYWKYAIAEQNNNTKSFLDCSNQITACGDWCIKSRVEYAFLSALNAFNTTEKILSN